MLSFAVCEDEACFTTVLERLLHQYAESRKTGLAIQCFTDGEALLHSRQPFDVILMDIKLPGMNGTDIMRQLRDRGNRSQLIFTTAYPEYALEAFVLDTIHYLLKPVTAENLFPAVDRAVSRIPHKDEKYLLLSKTGGVTKLKLKEILYCEAFDHQIIIHTLSGKIQFFGSLDALQKELDGRFFRCHRSYIANLDFVVDTEAGAAVFEGGGKALISRRKRQEFTRRLLASCRKGLS